MKIHPTLEGHSRDRLGDYYPSSSCDDYERNYRQPFTPEWARRKAIEMKKLENKKIAADFVFNVSMLMFAVLILWYFITGGSQ